jgi:putative hydrolase of the HAD superfamily
MSGLRVIFDLDDTLYPERAFAISAFAAASEWARTTLGVDGLADDMIRLLDNGHLGALFRMVLERRGIDPVHGADLIAAYRRHEPIQLGLYPDSEAALQHFARHGPLGLITDGTPSVQRAKVRALGLAERFQHIIYTHELGGREFAKPHACAFEAMQRELGIAGDRFVYVGDNPSKDFVAPNRMGWTTVQVVRPQRIHASAKVAEGGDPRHVVETLAELPELLKS